ncbi:MAG: nitrite reductase large subunit NirB [Pleurocapsa minor HA4230-MV1]|jgi:NAD(P)H-dependent nitrite reductase small subunit|nr:nitrite reductase large subunit NirB [Pleurocapsa minor HA4230-MV1]
MTNKKNLVVVGNGMVGHKFLELMVQKDVSKQWNLVTFCEEPRVAYDRVNLSGYFSGKTAGDLTLVEPGYYQENNVEIHIGDRVVAIDRDRQKVISANGIEINYDKLVLATGSYPFVPPIKGNDSLGTFVYRTIEDLENMEAWGKQSQVGVVVGGGLLGLECANALKSMGLETHVVEFAPRLMPVQIDETGGEVLKEKIQALGVQVHTSKSTTNIVSANGKLVKMEFADGGELATDMIVFSAGIRPRDNLARESGLTLGERDGIVVNEHCLTSDRNIYAIGECALYHNQIFGLVAPGYRMAEVASDSITQAGSRTFEGADMSTKLKLLGVDVASFGDNFGRTPGAKELALTDAINGTYKKLVLSEDGKLLLGGILIGDASAYGNLLQLVQNQITLPPHPEDLLVSPREGSTAPLLGVDNLPDTAQICSCNNVSKMDLCNAISDGVMDLGALKKSTKAGTGCGGCVPLVTDIFKTELKKAGTVKSCVGSTWCRFGVDDSTGLAIEVEERYRGLRSPHKLKSAVSGCTRECAEAQSKDFGIIATENGWNLYVCGNGGMNPQHAVLLATDIDKATLIKYIDRFLMFYIRTADKLQRTSVWFSKLEGGLDYLKSVVIDDSLGICDELETQMQQLVDTYQCEWKAIFRLGETESVYALSNYDPFSKAYVLSRGLVGDRQGIIKVAAPIYKQNINLATGEYLDDPEIKIPTYPVRVVNGEVQLGN